MQLKSFQVQGLFGRYNHKVEFPLRPEDSKEPSLVLLCGPNGIGKTTILKMIYGIKLLNFNPFREIPFSSAKLKFSDNSYISVKPAIRKIRSDEYECLRITYQDLQADLGTTQTGSLLKKETDIIENFREKFLNGTTGITINFVTTARLEGLHLAHAKQKEKRQKHEVVKEKYDDEPPDHLIHEKHRQKNALLSERIKGFIREAQLNYRRFFTMDQPGLFPKIIERLSEAPECNYNKKNLITRLQQIADIDQKCSKYEIFTEKWDFNQLRTVLLRRGSQAPNDHALTVINTYAEYLESRASEREMLIQRLQTFEQTANDFLMDKSVSIHSEYGLRILMQDKAELPESGLSSGEYHLLYLLVIALTTETRGTVIVIDEPEISMHLEWQRKLVRGILHCASMAQIQLIMATHSPDITAEHADCCVHLKAGRK